jgi:PilZ domain-containing protein
MESELRASPRYPFYASAELTESTSAAPTAAHTSNLGSNGCFLNTSNPLPAGTIVSIQITYQGQVFAARGVVAHSHPNTGMGLKFIALESGCASILETWLDEAALA